MWLPKKNEVEVSIGKSSINGLFSIPTMWGPQMIGKLVNINLQAMHQLSLQNNKHLRKCVMTCADFAQQLRLKGLNVEVMRSTVGSQQSSRALCTFTQHHHKIPAWWRKLFAQLLWSRLSCLSLTDAGSP
jgi:hypothetical protein